VNDILLGKIQPKEAVTALMTLPLRVED